jgi:hypothetical protein
MISFGAERERERTETEVEERERQQSRFSGVEMRLKG